MCHGLVCLQTFILHLSRAYLQSHFTYYVPCSGSDVIAMSKFFLKIAFIFILFRAIPGCLGSSGHFKNRFSDPIEQAQRHSTTKRVLATGRKAVKALVRKISCWFLRRTKALIKEQLPKKDDRVRLVKSNQAKSFQWFSILWKIHHLLDIPLS